MAAATAPPPRASGDAVLGREHRGGVSLIGLNCVLAVAGFGELNDVFVAVGERPPEQFVPGRRCRSGLLEAAGFVSGAAGEHGQQCGVQAPQRGQRDVVVARREMGQHDSQGGRRGKTVNERHRTVRRPLNCIRSWMIETIRRMYSYLSGCVAGQQVQAGGQVTDWAWSSD